MRKSRGIRIAILGIVLLAAVAVGGVFYVLRTYTVSTVYVEGNVHYTDEAIKDIVMKGFLGNNSLYLSLKYKNRGVKGIPFVDVMDVTILAPDAVRITVYEKALTGYVEYLGTYLYFDKDGYVVVEMYEKTDGCVGLREDGKEKHLIPTGPQTAIVRNLYTDTFVKLVHTEERGYYAIQYGSRMIPKS